MVTIELDPARERHLDELARSQGEDAALVAQRILSDYLDFVSLPEKEDDDAWAEASVKMAATAFESEDWNTLFPTKLAEVEQALKFALELQ